MKRVSEDRDAASRSPAGERPIEAGFLLGRERELAGGGVLERVLDARGLRDRGHAGAADEEGERHLAGSGAVRPRDLCEQPPARAPRAGKRPEPKGLL